MLWAQFKAKKLYSSQIQAHQHKARKPIGTVLKNIAKEMDFIGLVLVAASLALILLPFTLAPLADGGWNNPSMIAMIVIGFVLFPVFCFYDAKYATYPIVPYKFLKNTTILASCIIGRPCKAEQLAMNLRLTCLRFLLLGFTDFVSFYLQYTNLYNFVYTTQDWEIRYLTYFSLTQTVALTFFAIVGGAIMSYTRDVKVSAFFLRAPPYKVSCI